MDTYVLELSDGRREYIAARTYSQARFRADSVARKIEKSITYKLRPATQEEQKMLLAAHTIDFGADID